MQPAETWRLFIALAVPAAVRRDLAALQADWQSALPPIAVRWTHCDQLHVTLKFLGDVPANRIDALIEALKPVARASAPLRLAAQGVGVFPNARAPRVLWVGLNDSAGGLSQLQQAIETAGTGFGRSEASGPFTGHITLGRIRENARSISTVVNDLVTAAAERHFGEWTAASFEIMRSELSQVGATHTRVADLPLGREHSQPDR